MRKEKFIEISNQKHNNKYDYSKLDEFFNVKDKICIICPKHGEFWQIADDHQRGKGCSKCGREISAEKTKLEKENFIKKSIELHKNGYDEAIYDYSNVNYINNSTKVCIICHKHGEFWQLPSNHLQGKGCQKCARERNIMSKKTTKEEFIKKAKAKHGDKYSYLKSDYVNNLTEICIICPIHGEFWQIPKVHLKGCGCPYCGHESSSSKKRKELRDFIFEANIVHQNKYDYSQIKIMNNCKIKVPIVCPNHGIFYQSFSEHLKGKGCPLCHQSKLERLIKLKLEEYNIDFEEQKQFLWLKTSKGKMRVDFYLPKYNTIIECQGIQHFKQVSRFGGEKSLKEQIERDKLKKRLCEENNVKIIYFSQLHIEYPYNVYEDADKLINDIIS